MATFKWVLLNVFLVFLLACGGSESEPGEEGGETITATLSRIQEDVFTPTCAVSGCHSSGSASGGLVLEEGSAFSNLVNADSTETSLKRISPGDPDNSYLVKKLEGTQSSGSRMPKNGSPLSDEEIQAIRDWITNGAADN